ncbi:ADP-ribosylglycohydrolase [Arthrobacter pigmenti]|uniref:ADP-ribosylglycohydrolase n=1 Tax=Arthrobacter pigmenti TaxID=271432 RepID=A0A846RQL8_9MICC|nr:ADP-ribosylglycohydrolase [Arthrobacter pigmenti]
MTFRLTWTQPEDLVPHGLRAAEDEGRHTSRIRERWLAAGGSVEPPVSGASDAPASANLRSLARDLLDELDTLPVSGHLSDTEPEIPVLASPVAAASTTAVRDRVRGAWLGRAAGCLLGKPVEKIPREGIRRIAQSTGNWPISSYFTACGLDPAVGEQYPWNRRSRGTSLLENIAGMPEDDDLNFPLIALTILEQHGTGFTTDHVAKAWLDNLPGGRVFTAERIAYRNLLDGYAPLDAGGHRNPFREWIGAQIRADVYGWVLPGRPEEAAELARQDAMLSHRRSGVYGAMFVAAAASASLTADGVDDVLVAGLSVVPPQSRYRHAIEVGAELGRSGQDTETALDALHSEFGHFHWVHSLNNSALLAFALTRSSRSHTEGDFAQAITTAVTGGWDTDSTAATVGSLCGGLLGAEALPSSWTNPLQDRLASSVPGFDGISFDELTDRTVRLQEKFGMKSEDGAE